MLLVAAPRGGLASPATFSINVAMVIAEDMALSPLQVMERDAVSLLNLVYEGLVTLDDNRQPQPNLATSWEYLNDNQTWLFHIREGVYFHDGQELDAYDVKATMDAIMLLNSNADLSATEKGPYALFAEVWSSCDADDARTLRVRTNRPYYALLYSMTFPVLQAQTMYDPIPPGTGPYRIEYYKAGDELTLRGNENWWGPTPYVSEVTGIWFASVEEALRAFEAETVDVVMTRSSAATRYRGTVTSRANTYDFSTRQLECLMINHYGTELGKTEMRKAIFCAINKSRLVTNVYQSMATQTDTISQPGTWLYNENIANSSDAGLKHVSYNPDEANRILDELGWTLRDADGYRIKRKDSGDEQLSFRLNYYDEPGNALRKQAADEIAAMLEAVGIKVTVTAMAYDKAVANMESGNYHLFLCAYNIDVVPDPYFMLHSSKSKDGNYATYRSDEMNKLLTSLRQADEAYEFQSLWFDIQELMIRDAVFVPLYWREGIIVTRYPFSSVRDIREFELLRSIERYK